MNRIFIIYFIFLFPFFLFPQETKRENIWMLGAAAAPGYPQFGIDFNSGFADTFSLQRPMAFFLTNASICDTNGQLLFYTNGNYVSNRKHEMFPGTSGFNPGTENDNTYPFGSGIYQGALILPYPERYNEFIIIHMSADTFTIGNNAFTRPLSIRYSVIDIMQDSGYGDFTGIKNEVLLQDTLIAGRLTACRHANGRDWWIIAHELWSNRFYEFLLTPDTIQLIQTQNIGSVITQRMDALGTGIFSQNGEYFAFINIDTTLNIFNFDRCTGQLSNPVFTYFLDTLNLATISCAFSSSGRYLHVCNNFHIFQLDLQAADIPASKTIVATYDNYVTAQGFRTIFFVMKLAPDNKIYISTNEGSNIFHVINSPDSAGINCNVTQHSFILPEYNAFSMPNAPNFALSQLTGSICDSLNLGTTEINKNSSFSMYPNPSLGKINIRIDQDIDFKNGELQIFNSKGEKIFSSIIKDYPEIIDIDISRLPSGIYTGLLILGMEYYVIGKLLVIY
jgi:hypothetical protein